jgi:hypothetical protein
MQFKLYSFLVALKNYEKRILASSCPSARSSACKNSTPTGRVLIKFDI